MTFVTLMPEPRPNEKPSVLISIMFDTAWESEALARQPTVPNLQSAKHALAERLLLHGLAPLPEKRLQPRTHCPKRLRMGADHDAGLSRRGNRARAVDLETRALHDLGGAATPNRVRHGAASRPAAQHTPLWCP